MASARSPRPAGARFHQGDEQRPPSRRYHIAAVAGSVLRFDGAVGTGSDPPDCHVRQRCHRRSGHARSGETRRTTTSKARSTTSSSATRSRCSMPTTSPWTARARPSTSSTRRARITRIDQAWPVAHRLQFLRRHGHRHDHHRHALLRRRHAHPDRHRRADGREPDCRATSSSRWPAAN